MTIANLWLLVNQVQLFFLIFLTKAFIPDDVVTVLQGISFGLNPYSYLPASNSKDYISAMDYFNFPLTEPILGNLQLKAQSTLYNASSFFTFVGLAIVVHLLVMLVSK